MSKKEMKKIVITGTIGSGKSFVCNILKRQGKNVLDLDQIAKEVRNGVAKEEILTVFGKQILSSGEIDTNKLRDIVFNHQEKLDKLEEIIHPYVLQQMLQQFKEANEDVFVEMALLYEKGWQEYFDEIWLVKSKEEVALKRLVKKRNYTEEDAKNILNYQNMQRKDYSDVKHVIINNGNEEDIENQIRKII